MRTSRRVRAFVWSAARMLPSALLGISGLAVGFVARPACPAVGDTGAEPLTFFVTSDCHYKSGDKAAFNERNHATVLRMNSLPGSEFPDKVGGGKIGRPRGVLALGDLVDDGDRAGQTEPQWRSFVADFGLDGTDGVLRFPVFEGWGNHDGPPAAAAKGGFSVQAQIRERNQARRAKGLIANLSANGLHYSWDSGGVHFVQLNLYPGDRYHPQSKYSAVWHDPQMSLSFLTEDLRKNVASSGRPVVLAAHAGFDTDWWHRDEWKAFYDAVKPYNVIAYFHGHTGTGIYKWKPEGEEKPLDVVNTGQTENGFFVVEVGESRLRLGYYRKNVRNKEWDGTWDWQHFLQKTIQRAAPPQPAAAPGRPTAAPGEEGAAHRPAEAPGPGAAADKGRS
ncbi:MAG: hypothetical protein FJ288_16710, partial [Planctomycetes bacterium]|nr:hypothetical protein [Planctomycetota bacterium]